MVVDNFYAFAYNSTLLEVPMSELESIKDLRVKYLQVDNLNKCIPQDWFLGYDQFAVYTFLNLQKQISKRFHPILSGNGFDKNQTNPPIIKNENHEFMYGFIKTYFRPERGWKFNPVNNLDRFTLDYAARFKLSLFKNRVTQ